jgi:3-keto-L-gulonate-6-phosphate decarboxylase
MRLKRGLNIPAKELNLDSEVNIEVRVVVDVKVLDAGGFAVQVTFEVVDAEYFVVFR